MDANPVYGYILLSPSVASDFFVASPSTNTAQFIAQAYNGCDEGTPMKPILDTPNELTPFIENEFSLFPNPAFSSITLANKDLINTSLSVQIISIEGRVIQESTPINFNQFAAIDLGQIPNGFYILKITYSGKTTIMKFQKQ